MERYKLVVENPLDAFILDTKENMIVTLCNTKRPDLEFDTLKELIEKANRYDKQQKKQKFQLGDTAYMIDEDFNFFESEVCSIELIDGKYLYCTHDCDFYNEDIGEWVFESEMYREMHLEALSSKNKGVE